ncbi:hypothetical protein ACJZ2D_010327 [Fusarium nematophilum]
MGYNTETTDWPTVQITGPVKALIDRLFSLLDTQRPDAGDRLADEGLRNGANLDGEFMARVVVNDIQSETPKFRRYQVWAEL